MSPKIPRRYRPYGRPLSLHSTFPLERHNCPAHSLHKIYPTDSDVAAFEPPQPLAHPEAFLSAATYFVLEDSKRPISQKIAKPPGEVGRPGPSRKGYNLQTALAWPIEVFKEVQVRFFVLFWFTLSV